MTLISIQLLRAHLKRITTVLILGHKLRQACHTFRLAYQLEYAATTGDETSVVIGISDGVEQIRINSLIKASA